MTARITIDLPLPDDWTDPLDLSMRQNLYESFVRIPGQHYRMSAIDLMTTAGKLPTNARHDAIIEAMRLDYLKWAKLTSDLVWGYQLLP